MPFLILIKICYNYLRQQSINTKITLALLVLSVCEILYCFFFWSHFVSVFDSLTDIFWWWKSKSPTYISLILPLLVDLMISWWIEYELLKDHLPVDKKNLSKSVLMANVLSYSFLLIIAFVFYLVTNRLIF